MNTDSNEVQLRKASTPITRSDSGILISFKLLQKAKASSLMTSIPSGTTNFSRCVKPAKAEVPISFTEEGIVVLGQTSSKELRLVSIMALQLSRES